MDIEEIKSYLRVDDTDDDDLIQELQTAAEEYMANAGVAKEYDRAVYKFAIKLLVSHWYDNRGPVNVGSISKSLEYSLASLPAQLKYTQTETS